jgi:hypothetical protein
VKKTAKTPKKLPKLDIIVSGEWGLYSCTPLTKRARTFVEGKVILDSWQDPAHFHVEGGDRIRAIIAGMVKDGLRVEVNGADMTGYRYE